MKKYFISTIKFIVKKISAYSKFINTIKYYNPYEMKTALQLGFCDMTKSQDFKEKYENLIKNLPHESIKTISDIVSRLSIIKEDKEHDFFSLCEQKELEDLSKFQHSIFQISSACFCYEKYFLPIKHFEQSVFLSKHGLHLLKNKEELMDKAIIDVGAFIGDSALIFSELTEGKIYCFEAVQKNYELLLKTISMNNVNNIEPIKLGLGSSTQRMDINVLGSASTLTDRLQIDNLDKETISIVTLDDYVSTNNISNIGLIKVDIEGFEQEFLKGALETIKKQKPILLISIYHNVSDFLEIKPFIENLNLDYSFKVYKPVSGTILSETLLICE